MGYKRGGVGWALFGLGAAFLLQAGHATADVSETDKATAQALFDDGRALLEQSKFAEACERFANSQRLDPSGGTLLNLAACHEKMNKIATAWSEFNEALSLAIRDGRADRQSFARDRIAVLEPKLSRLTVRVGKNASVEGFEIKLDGSSLSRVAWGIAAPIDPGDHVLVASAPGWLSIEKKVSVLIKESKTVELPPLAEDPNAKPIPPPDGAGVSAPAPSTPVRELPPSPPPEDHHARRTAGFVVGAAGIAVAGAGALFGILAISNWNASNNGCPNDVCTSEGASKADSAKTDARVADILVPLGIVGIATGAVLVLTSPANTSNSVGLQMRLGPVARGSGVYLDGAW